VRLRGGQQCEQLIEALTVGICDAHRPHDHIRLAMIVNISYRGKSAERALTARSKVAKKFGSGRLRRPTVDALVVVVNEAEDKLKAFVGQQRRKRR